MGITTTRLAQIGYAEIEGNIIEVKSTEGLLDEKTPIIVNRIADGTIFVEKQKPKYSLNSRLIMNIEPMYQTILPIAGGIILLVLFFHYVPFFLWLSAKVSGVNISLVQLFLMRIRNVPPYIIVPGMIEAHKAGLNKITRNELEPQ